MARLNLTPGRKLCTFQEHEQYVIIKCVRNTFSYIILELKIFSIQCNYCISEALRGPIYTCCRYTHLCGGLRTLFVAVFMFPPAMLSGCCKAQE